MGTGLLALILSVVVWVNATYEGDRPREDYFPELVPIQVLNAPAGLAITRAPAEHVKVRIRAFASSWSALTVDSFTATANWQGLGEGLHKVPIKVACADRTVTVISVQPDVAYVGLERVLKEAIEATVQLEDKEELPLGYAVDPPEVEPRFVSVEGPVSAVKRVAMLIVPVSLKGQRTTVESDVEPRPVDENGRLVTGVKLTPQVVRVRFDITKKLNYREVAVRARTKGHPARGYFISSVNVEPSTVTVFGPPASIAAMSGLVSVKGEVDVTGATRMFAERKELELPMGISVLTDRQGQSSSVLVTVEIDPVMGGTTVELPLKVKKLQSGLVAKLSVPAVDVILTGPSVLLDDLQTDLLDAYVDLSGLGVGSHQVKTKVDILVSKHTKLMDLVVTSISPEFVEADIRELSALTPVPPPGWLVPELSVLATRTPTATVTVTGTLTATVTVTRTVIPTATVVNR